MEPEEKRKALVWMASIATLALFYAIGNRPFNYYQFLRWTIFVIGGVSAYFSYELRAGFWTVFSVIAAIIFNPLSPLTFVRATWQKYDLLIGLVFASMAAYFYLKRTTAHNITKDLD